MMYYVEEILCIQLKIKVYMQLRKWTTRFSEPAIGMFAIEILSQKAANLTCIANETKCGLFLLLKICKTSLTY